VVSFDGFASGGEPGPAAGNGGSSGGSSGGDGGMSGSTGGDSGSQGGGGKPPDDGSPGDARPDVSPRGPFLFYQAFVPLGGIAVDATDVYWVEAGPSGGVYRLPTSGQGIPTAVIRTTSQEGPIFDVAVDTGNVYFNRLNIAWQLPKGSTTPAKRLEVGLSTRFITVDDLGYVYVTTFEGYVVSSRGNPSSITFSNQIGATGIAFYTDVSADVLQRDLAWGHGAGVRQGSVDGGGFMDIYMSDSDVTAAGVATDSTDIYWITSSGRLRASPSPKLKPTQNPRSVCQAPPGFAVDAGIGVPADVAVDATWVYFTNPTTNQILKCVKD
jgi:hypothetical protein